MRRKYRPAKLAALIQVKVFPDFSWRALSP
jgi:hypothetical protein